MLFRLKELHRPLKEMCGVSSCWCSISVVLAGFLKSNDIEISSCLFIHKLCQCKDYLYNFTSLVVQSAIGNKFGDMPILRFIINFSIKIIVSTVYHTVLILHVVIKSHFNYAVRDSYASLSLVHHSLDCFFFSYLFLTYNPSLSRQLKTYCTKSYSASTLVVYVSWSNLCSSYSLPLLQ